MALSCLPYMKLMLNSNGRVGAADGLRERAFDSGVERRLQICDWNTIRAAGASMGARRKRKRLSCPEYLACSYSILLIPLSNSHSYAAVSALLSLSDESLVQKLEFLTRSCRYRSAEAMPHDLPRHSCCPPLLSKHATAAAPPSRQTC